MRRGYPCADRGSSNSNVSAFDSRKGFLNLSWQIVSTALLSRARIVGCLNEFNANMIKLHFLIELNAKLVFMNLRCLDGIRIADAVEDGNQCLFSHIIFSGIFSIM